VTREAMQSQLREAQRNLSRIIARWDTLDTRRRAKVARLLSQWRRCAKDLGVVACARCPDTGLGFPPLIIGAVAVAGGAGWLGWRLRSLLAGSQDVEAFTECVRQALASGEAATPEDARKLCDGRAASPLFWLGIGGGLVGAATLLAPHIRQLRGSE